MANYRQIHVSIWKDEWFLDLDPLEKLLFIYLFSNESTSLAGIYKIPLKVIAFETCLDVDFIQATLEKFAKVNKVHFENGIIWVVNMRQYHETKSPKVATRIASDIAAIPDCKLKIQYQYGINTDPQLKEEEKEKEDKRNHNEQDAANAAPSPELTEGQRFILDSFGAKRFKTRIQKDTVLENESKYGFDVLKQYITWAATKGMSLGDAVGAMEKTLPKWGKPKSEIDLKDELRRNGYIVH